MGGFLDEIEGLMTAPSEAAGPTLAPAPVPLSREVDTLMNAERPAAERGRVFGGPVTDQMVEMADWVRRNPDQVAHFLVQAGFATAGTLAGVPAGPPGMAVGGGLGNLAGDIVGRGLTGQEAPTLAEGAVDAGVGGLAALAGPAPRAVGRMITGANSPVRETARQAGTAAAREAEEATFNRMVQELPANLSPEERARRILDEIRKSAMSAAEGARQNTIRQGLGAGEHSAGRVFDIVAMGPAAVQALQGDLPAAAMWLAGGAGASYVRRGVAETLLNNPRVVDWMLRPQISQRMKGASAASVLGALAGQRWLNADERGLVSILTSEKAE